MTVHANRIPSKRAGGELEIVCAFTGRPSTIPCATLVPVAARVPETALFDDLRDACPDRAVSRIGDCHSPGTIAASVYSGHRFARQYGETIDPDSVPFKREEIVVL